MRARKFMALAIAAAMVIPTASVAMAEEQTTFRIFAGVSALSPDNSEKPLVQQMNEAMGVEIQWDCISGDTLTEKKNLTLNSGVNMPDAFMAAGLTDYELITYGGYGVLIPLEDYINEETMPSLMAIVEKNISKFSFNGFFTSLNTITHINLFLLLPLRSILIYRQP